MQIGFPSSARIHPLLCCRLVLQLGLPKNAFYCRAPPRSLLDQRIDRGEEGIYYNPQVGTFGAVYGVIQYTKESTGAHARLAHFMCQNSCFAHVF